MSSLFLFRTFLVLSEMCYRKLFQIKSFLFKEVSLKMAFNQSEMVTSLTHPLFVHAKILILSGLAFQR